MERMRGRERGERREDESRRREEEGNKNR